jgi:hypothetical protein
MTDLETAAKPKSAAKPKGKDTARLSDILIRCGWTAKLAG